MPDITVAASGKKGLRLEIQNQLNQSLTHLKEILGEKKFSNKIKEAARLLAKGVKLEDTSKKAAKEEKKANSKNKAVEAAVKPVAEVKSKVKAIADANPMPKKVTGKSTAKSAR